MIATYVPARLTPLTFADAAEALRAALHDKLKARPTNEALALALAKTGLETGRWRSMWCHNWGNVKASDRYVGMYTCITLNEVLRGKVVWFSPEAELTSKPGPGCMRVGQRYDVPPGHPQTRMRAYANRFDGAFAYVDFVAGGRYTDAFQRLLAGDAAGYVRGLKAKGYFTADEATYAKAVIGLQREFLGKIEGKAPDEHALEPDDMVAIRAAVADQQFDVSNILEGERNRELAEHDTEPPEAADTEPPEA